MGFEKQEKGVLGGALKLAYFEVGCKKACHPPEQLARARAECCSFQAIPTVESWRWRNYDIFLLGYCFGSDAYLVLLDRTLFEKAKQGDKLIS